MRDSSTTICSYAKINLTLDVLGIRSDGYHTIESVMQSISLHDVITLTESDTPGIRISCTMPWIPTDERNLAHKAASLLFHACGTSSGLEIHIEKNIPTQAGLGGGSSNAAAVLIGMNRLFQLSVEPDILLETAAVVGSDVPFFLTGGTAHVTGRGENVRPLPDIRPLWMVIVKPSFGISTAWSYRRIDEMRAETRLSDSESASSRLVSEITGEGFAEFSKFLRNDLEAPAIEQHSEIREIKSSLLANGAVAALMCGSGSAVFGMFEEERLAFPALQKLSPHGSCSLCTTLARKKVFEEG